MADQERKMGEKQRKEIPKCREGQTSGLGEKVRGSERMERGKREEGGDRGRT